MWRPRGVLVLLAVLACTSTACAKRTTAVPVPRPFAPTSFWNAPLAADAPLDPASGAYVADLRRMLTRWRPWINTTRYSAPVYTVPAGQPS